MKTYIQTVAMVLLMLTILGSTTLNAQRRYDFVKQGFSMKLQMNNLGAFGRVAYPPFSVNPNPPAAESLGLEYPLGQDIEHVYGGGLWIGGKVDTSRFGTSAPLKLVTVSYEGWAGPYWECFPGTDPRDGFWQADRNDTAPPPGWYDYWGSSLPFNPISDKDLYCTYTDTAVRVTDHVPMRIKVIQASYAWDDPYADGIIINEYRIINMGRNRIDSLYMGFFFEADVGPINVPNYWTHDFSEFLEGAHVAYIHNPQDEGSTPVGIVPLFPSAEEISQLNLRETFQWFPGATTPATDALKYAMLSSGTKDPSEYPNLSDTRFAYSFGPFNVQPRDTLKIAVAIVSGYSRRVDHRLDLQEKATRALNIYLNQGISLPATPPSPPLRATVGFRRVELDWRWRPGDDVLFGRKDPETNWDTTNQRARNFPTRISPPYPPGIDSSRGGRNFESYRLWRSENPEMTDQSFTLLKQFDIREDDNDTMKFAYETGLQYTFVDSNLVRGKTYVYSVTSTSIPNVVYVAGADSGDPDIPVEVAPLESGKLTNAVRVDLPFAVSSELGKVSVVPNPYRTDKDYTLENGGYEGLAGNWDENRRLVKFINLPEVCTVRIFSLSGDLVRTIEHDGRDGGDFSRGDHDVELVSESNRALASGIYLFTVESQFGSQTGKFVIIR